MSTPKTEGGQTPTPWKVTRDSDTRLSIVAPWSADVTPGAHGWGDYQGIHVAHLNHHSGDGMVPREHAEANAAFIVKAANNFDALVEALEAIESALRTDAEPPANVGDARVYKLDGQVMYFVINKARAALAAAQGEA